MVKMMGDFVSGGQTRLKVRFAPMVYQPCKGCGSTKVEESVAWNQYSLFGPYLCFSCGHLDDNYVPLKDGDD